MKVKKLKRPQINKNFNKFFGEAGVNILNRYSTSQTIKAIKGDTADGFREIRNQIKTHKLNPLKNFVQKAGTGGAGGVFNIYEGKGKLGGTYRKAIDKSYFKAGRVSKGKLGGRRTATGKPNIVVYGKLR